jgi:hypothetical protein
VAIYIAEIKENGYIIFLAPNVGPFKEAAEKSNDENCYNSLQKQPSRLALGLTESPIQWVPGPLSLG